jgi:hypothetical protein
MPETLPRPLLQARLADALRRSRAVALVGPRQTGKTTLARGLLPPGSPGYFDLEDPRDLARLAEPLTALEPLKGLVVIDEIQRRPDLFPVLRVLVDRSDAPGRFLLLGSASPVLLRQSGESLAGRLELIETGGFLLRDVGTNALDVLWTRGGFPRSWLAASDEDSDAWRRSFIRLVIESDLPAMGIGVAAAAMERFWSMVAHYHGQVWNAAEPARSLGVSETTIRRYLDILTDTYLVRQLKPWHENLGKRQIRAPKVYVRDSGLLHALLGIRTAAELLRHPKAGASWEGFMLEQVLAAARPDEAWFWGTHQGAELDLLMIKGGRRVGVEFKRADAPTLTPSMRIACNDLALDRLLVVYPGSKSWRLSDRVEVVPAAEVAAFEA